MISATNFQNFFDQITDGNFKASRNAKPTDEKLEMIREFIKKIDFEKVPSVGEEKTANMSSFDEILGSLFTKETEKYGSHIKSKPEIAEDIKLLEIIKQIIINIKQQSFEKLPNDWTETCKINETTSFKFCANYCNQGWAEKSPNNLQIKVEMISEVVGKNLEDVVSSDVAFLVQRHVKTGSPMYNFASEMKDLSETNCFTFSYWAASVENENTIKIIPYRFGSGCFKQDKKLNFKQNAIAALFGYYRDHVKDSKENQSKQVYEKWSPFLKNVEQFHTLGKEGKAYSLAMI